jgi:ribosomal protein S27E
MSYSYDPHCEELARWFLADNPELYSDANLADLATEIQGTIEAWIEQYMSPKCHPCNPVYVRYEKATGSIRIECARCSSVVAEAEIK